MSRPTPYDSALMATYPPSPHPASRGVVGYAPGVFDTFHIGHLNVLRRASLQCDYLIAGVTSDEVTLAQKGKPPLVPAAERIEIVRSMEFVDDVVLEVTSDKIVTWEDVRFDICFKGDDWKGTAKWDGLEEQFARRGARVVYLPYTLHTSTSNVRRQLGDTTASIASSDV
jgi:glycerol-3-phosphate cytidylyltransferase